MAKTNGKPKAAKPASEVTDEQAEKILAERQAKRMKDASAEIAAICQKYGVTIQPRIIVDLVPNK